MNSGEQLSSLIIGDRKAVNDLAEKETSRILVISDSHDIITIVQRIIEKSDTVYDALIFCGDGIGGLFAIFSKAIQDNDFAQKIPPVISFVRGNVDPDKVTYRNLKRITDSSAALYCSTELPLTQSLCVSGMNIFSAHGHLYSFDFGIEDALAVSKRFNADIILYGHSHIHDAQRLGNVLVLNPGSCSKPRGGQKATYAEIVIDKEKKFADYSFIEVD